jgi:hypothetical protein
MRRGRSSFSDWPFFSEAQYYCVLVQSTGSTNSPGSALVRVGNPIWQLAPREMAWEGKTLAEICAQIKDPARNGNRSVDALIEHIGEDHLVGWAWAPGYGRQPAPGTQKQARALVEAWVKTGAECPN